MCRFLSLLCLSCFMLVGVGCGRSGDSSAKPSGEKEAAIRKEMEEKTKKSMEDKMKELEAGKPASAQ